MSGTRSALSPTLLLGILAGALAVALLATWGLRSYGDETPSLGDQVAAVSNTPQEVAEQVTLAFLDVDYRDMAPRVAKVLDLATGKFYDEYKAAEANLTAGAVEGQAMSTGEVTYVGLGKVGPGTAQVLLAAKSTVTNKLIEAAKAKGQKVDDERDYRVQVDLTLVDGHWRANDLRFVP